MSEIDPASETTKKQKILGLFVPSTVPKIISILELLEILHRTSMLLQSRENAAKIEKSDAMLKNQKTTKMFVNMCQQIVDIFG